jgi:hypothetical protein
MMSTLHATSHFGEQETVTSSWSSPSARSNPIAIKGHRDEGLLHEEANAAACDKVMYEDSTWRLYFRILDHREKNPLKNCNFQVSAGMNVSLRASTNATTRMLMGKMKLSTAPESNITPTSRGDDSPLVFELDI